MEPKWQRKVDALILLAEDQKGKPEGDLARKKLKEILRNHSEARSYPPMVELMRRGLQLKDIGMIHKQGISTGGQWHGANLEEAVANMIQDYKRRIMKKAPQDPAAEQDPQ